MRLTNILGALCCATLLGVVAMAQSKDLSAGDKAFLKTAAEAEMTEAHMGQMAESQASAADVKDFGKKLDQDHTAAYSEISGVANKIGTYGLAVLARRHEIPFVVVAPTSTVDQSVG